MLAQHDRYERKSDRILICVSIAQAKAKTNPQIFICNRFCVDGKFSGKTWRSVDRDADKEDEVFGTSF